MPDRWDVSLYLDEYQIELDRFDDFARESCRQTCEWLEVLLTEAFNAPFHESLRETLLDICATVDDMFVLGQGCASRLANDEVLQGEVRRVLATAAWQGNLRIRQAEPSAAPLSNIPQDDRVQPSAADRQRRGSQPRTPPQEVALPPQALICPVTEPAPSPLAPELTWIEVQIVDDSARPISGKQARLHLTDGRVVQQVLGPTGTMRADDIPVGVCKLVLPVQDRAEWIDLDASAPAQALNKPSQGHWVVRNRIKPPGPEVPDLRTAERHTVVVGRKIVEQFEIDDALFRLSSAVLLPDAQNPGADPTDPNGIRPTTMDLLAASLRYAELHLDRKILITGHADTSGEDQYNQDLSEYRAGAVCAVLANRVGSRDAFGDLCHGPHLLGKERKQQVLYKDRVQVLNWVSTNFGWPCSTSGEFGDYLQAVRGFQRTYNIEGNNRKPIERLAIDADFGPAVWRAVFDCYQVHLSETLEVTAQELQALQGRVRAQFLKPFVGCGENKPKEMAGIDNYRSQTNRRVEVLYFETPDHVPDTPCLRGECDPRACELYDCRWYLHRRLTSQRTPKESEFVEIQVLRVFLPGHVPPYTVQGEGLEMFAGEEDRDRIIVVDYASKKPNPEIAFPNLYGYMRLVGAYTGKRMTMQEWDQSISREAEASEGDGFRGAFPVFRAIDWSFEDTCYDEPGIDELLAANPSIPRALEVQA